MGPHWGEAPSPTPVTLKLGGLKGPEPGYDKRFVGVQGERAFFSKEA